MKSIAFFNNKGGVGKTTLACNLASFLATRHSLRVLLVDLDPQCNATQLVLPADVVEQLYWSEGKGVSDDGRVDTVYEALKPLEEGEASLAQAAPLGVDSNRFGISILAGHPRMSVMEDLLGQWFADVTAGEISGLRKTNWLAQLNAQMATEYDVLIYDLGPSLGSLNRSVLSSTKYFMTPMGADIFSLVALRNIAEWMQQWLALYKQGVNLCHARYPGSAERYGIIDDLAIQHGFVGYTVQQYFTVTIRGERRPTNAYEEILREIPSQVSRGLHDFIAPGLDLQSVRLGDVPNLRSLVPLAQSANAPIAGLTSKDGLAGGQYSQQKKYTDLISAVGQRLYENCGLGG